MRALLIVCVMVMGSQTVLAYTGLDCIRCHSEGSEGSRLHVSVEEFGSSVHGREGMACPDCHKGIRGPAHQRAQGRDCVACGECHQQENRHGMGSDRRPQCASCHTRHRILEKANAESSVHRASLKRTCSSCHSAECGKSDYLSWLPSRQIVSHGKQDLSRAYSRDNCIGCHQGAAIHGEAGPVDRQDCAKCHGALMGRMHPKADARTEPGVFTAAVIYQILLAVFLVGGFVLTILRLSISEWGKGKTRS
jgi:hypothetical protein